MKRRARLGAWVLGLGQEREARGKRRSKIRHLQPQMARAVRLLRAASRLGVPGSVPAPPELLPMGARVLAQGYLNRFSMPLLGGWLLPRWMREQSDPDSPLFTPRSVLNLMVNQTARNWTALGIPGADHPVESVVDRWGLLTPVPGGPSLDWWVQVEGGEKGLLAPSQQVVTQRLQGDLPVALSAYEADGLRVSSESWLLPLQSSDWAAMQVVLFNIADLPLRGAFYFALRPYNAEGISPIYNVAFDGETLLADGRPGPVTWPAPEGWALSGVRQGDLFRVRSGECGVRNDSGTQHSALVHDPHGFAHGVLRYSFNIEPWEEAEFLAFMPVHSRKRAPTRTRRRAKPLFNLPDVDLQLRAPEAASRKYAIRNTQYAIDPQFYSRAKAATTLEWRALLGGGMEVSLPHRELQASWEANRAHVLALHDGDEITPGPDIYHSFWFRDAAYMTHALSICGYREAAAQLLRGFVRRQRRDGAFVSHYGEWDSTGQALWTMGQHLRLHPDQALMAELKPSIERGADWIAATLAKSPDGLMPPGISSEHLGPPDRYYWDSIWSLAGLEAVRGSKFKVQSSRFRVQSPTSESDFGPRKVAQQLRRTLLRSWVTDVAAIGRESLVAAPGRPLDLGAIGTLVAWFPLGIMPPDSPLLAGTLAALEETLFYKGALFVNTGHSGWGTYLNMRLAGCYLLGDPARGCEHMLRLLEYASPTLNWPEAIHPRTSGQWAVSSGQYEAPTANRRLPTAHSSGGSAGDGHHGWASAEWLMLVRALLVAESGRSLHITPALPPQWLEQAGSIGVRNAPTRFGHLTYRVEWDDGAGTLRLDLDTTWRTPPKETLWRLPGHIKSAQADGQPTMWSESGVVVPLGAKSVSVKRGMWNVTSDE